MLKIPQISTLKRQQNKKHKNTRKEIVLHIATTRSDVGDTTDINLETPAEQETQEHKNKDCFA
ncbi:hypothetical protein HYALB_00013004 [Hymenoscyphus albidus]|uniref:Uncharacterized protein n=1 Tax=Hymenoscyphus albidus TaxID=595503 RepID=A0A9N9Q2T4_9HELO|nr:hypothetical protein HYALB_00013004 [Hymenoscyphus albidus]